VTGICPVNSIFGKFTIFKCEDAPLNSWIGPQIWLFERSKCFSAGRVNIDVGISLQKEEKKLGML